MKKNLIITLAKHTRAKDILFFQITPAEDFNFFTKRGYDKKWNLHTTKPIRFEDAAKVRDFTREYLAIVLEGSFVYAPLNTEYAMTIDEAIETINAIIDHDEKADWEA